MYFCYLCFASRLLMRLIFRASLGSLIFNSLGKAFDIEGRAYFISSVHANVYPSSCPAYSLFSLFAISFTLHIPTLARPWRRMSLMGGGLIQLYIWEPYIWPRSGSDSLQLRRKSATDWKIIRRIFCTNFRPYWLGHHPSS